MTYVNMDFKCEQEGRLYNFLFLDEEDKVEIEEIEISQVIQEALPDVRSVWKITNATPGELVAFVDATSEEIYMGRFNLRGSGVLWFQGERNALQFMQAARSMQLIPT